MSVDSPVDARGDAASRYTLPLLLCLLGAIGLSSWLRAPARLQPRADSTSFSTDDADFSQGRAFSQDHVFSQDGARHAEGTIAGIDPNRAPWWELTELPRVGEITARKIVAEREKGGAFAAASDIARVRGIGPKTVARISPHLQFAGASPDP